MEMPTHGTNKKPAHEKGTSTIPSMPWRSMFHSQKNCDHSKVAIMSSNSCTSIGTKPVYCIDWLTRRLHYHNCACSGRSHRMYCNGLSRVDYRRVSAWMPNFLRWNNWKPTIDLLMLALEKPRTHQQIGWKECRLHWAGLAEENCQKNEWLPRCHVIRKPDVWTCNFWMYT